VLKKLLLKAVMFGFVMFGLSLYAGYLVTGRLPPFIERFRGFLPESRAAGVQPNWSNIGALKHKTTAQDGNYEVVQGGKTVIYKWQDANGHWQYGERAPATGAHVTRQEIVIPATRVPVAKAATHESATNSNAENPGLVNPYSPDGVKQIMDKAHDVQRMMNQHNDQLSSE
jgi:hypothetical protein